MEILNRLPKTAKFLFCLSIICMSVNAASQSFAAALIRSNFASSITSGSMAPVWVAQKRGLFEKHGIQMQFILMPRAPLAIAALMVGEIDMAVVGPGHLLNAAFGGADIVGIGNFFQKLDYRFSGRPEIKTAEDLRGKRIAISGPAATSHIIAMLALQQLRIDPNQARINFITIPGTEMNRRIALETGNADATTLRGAVGDIYGRRGYPVLFNFAGSGITMPQTMMVTTRRIVASKPHLIEAYLKTIIEAIAYLFDPANKETSIRIVASNLRLNNPAEQEEAYQSVLESLERVPYPQLEGMKRLHGVLSSINPKLVEIRPETVVDEKPLRELEKSGFIRQFQKP
ncbi:MAG: ABC transporter substrate-binding protein [Deltaproteobacteria bacterium]|nr:ABC transporter substrate-binding protein [Deltaproteobacteria bacterium]